MRHTAAAHCHGRPPCAVAVDAGSGRTDSRTGGGVEADRRPRPDRSARHQGRLSHADGAADRLHGRARRWRRRAGRRVAARRRTRHARDGSARSARTWSTRSTPSSLPAAAPTASSADRRDALSRRTQDRLARLDRASCRSCRRRSCSTSGSAASGSPADRRLRLQGRSAARPPAPVAEGNVGAGAGATVGKMGDGRLR